MDKKTQLKDYNVKYFFSYFISAQLAASHKI
jgi:hypothetical protein